MEKFLHPVTNLEEAFDCYGKDNLVPITFLKQVKYYIQHCVQPILVYPKEGGNTIRKKNVGRNKANERLIMYG